MPDVRQMNIHSKKIGNVPKLKGHSFYEKMIDELGLYKNPKFTCDK